MVELAASLASVAAAGKWGAWVALVMLLGALWRGLPGVQREITARRAMERDGETALRAELRAALASLREDNETLANRLSAAEELQGRNLMRVSNLSFILQLVMGELRRVSPDNVVLAQAEGLLRADSGGSFDDLHLG